MRRSLGNYGVYDKDYPSSVTSNIHNYFIAKSLDKLRPGGVAMLITSAGTLNSVSADLRRELLKRADFEGAVRLPSTAFVGTGTVADVPASLVGQWTKEIYSYFPNAKVLAAQEGDVEGKGREVFTNKIITGDYDAIIISQTVFEKLPVSPDAELAYIEEMKAEIEAAISDSRADRATIRQLQDAIKKADFRAQKLLDSKKDEGNVRFEDCKPPPILQKSDSKDMKNHEYLPLILISA